MKWIKSVGGVLLLTELSVAHAVTLKEVSGILLEGGQVLTKLMWAVCVVVGIGVLAAAFTQFQIHRRNPKLVPLTTPVLYLILGVSAIALPFVNTMYGFLGESKEQVHGEAAPSKVGYDPNDIDAPY